MRGREMRLNVRFPDYGYNLGPKPGHDFAPWMRPACPWVSSERIHEKVAKEYAVSSSDLHQKTDAL